MNENDMFIPNEDAASENTGTTQDPTPWKCPECPKSFMTKAGLTMHDARVHSKTILARGQEGFKPSNKPKRHWVSQSTEYKRRAYREQVARYHARGLNAKGEPYKRNPGETREGTPPWTDLTKKKIRYVYPDPRDVEEQELAQPVTKTKAVKRFCPYCGENIEK